MSCQLSSKKMTVVTLAVALGLVVVIALDGNGAEAKLLRRSRYYDDYSSGYDGYGGGGSGIGMPTGERAIMTIRGARNPYDGSAPSKIAIEDNPYRGQYPRGVYDRLDGYGGGRGGLGGMGGLGGRYPRHDSYSMGGGYGGPYGGSGFGSMYGAPARIAVTGAYPYGYGSRY